MYECKQCKQKINKYYDEYSRSKDYNFILRILGCRNAGMQEIQKNELYAEKKGSRSPFAARALFLSFYSSFAFAHFMGVNELCSWSYRELTGFQPVEFFASKASKLERTDDRLFPLLFL